MLSLNRSSKLCILCKSNFRLISLVSMQSTKTWHSVCTLAPSHWHRRMSRGTRLHRPVSIFKSWDISRSLVKALRVKSGTYWSPEYTPCTLRPGFNTVLYVLNLVASSGLFDTKLIILVSGLELQLYCKASCINLKPGVLAFLHKLRTMWNGFQHIGWG